MSRRPLFASAVLVAGLTVAASPADATDFCYALADQPVTAGATVLGDARFSCDVPAAGMTITVCIESAALADPLTWRTEGCDTAYAAGSVAIVSGSVAVCYLGGPSLVRVAATGSNDEGDFAQAVSVENLAPGFGSCGP